MPDIEGRLKDYVEVRDRLIAFFEKFPDGSIQTSITESTDSRVTVRAYAFRKPDDVRPAIGHSWLQIPGKTPYTRGSELENAETSAVGRALAFLGFEVRRSIASGDEVRSKATGDPIASSATDEPEPMGETVAAGAIYLHGNVDGELRQTPDGWKLAFGLDLGKGRIPQVVLLDEMATDVFDAIGSDAANFKGLRVTVEGDLFDVPVVKDGKAVSRFKRIVARKLVSSDWTLPEPGDAITKPIWAEAAEPVKRVGWAHTEIKEAVKPTVTTT